MRRDVELDEYLTKKRWRKALKRKARIAERAFRLGVGKHLFAKRFGPTSQLISALAALWQEEVLFRRKARLQLKIPATFSIIENPVSALHVIGAFAKAARQRPLGHVAFDHRAIRGFDVAAKALLDLD